MRHRRLARLLRDQRERLGLKPEVVANEIGWDRSKISRLETAKVKPKPADLDALLDLYGVGSPERDGLLQLAREVRRRNWWASFPGVFDGTYVGLEDDASSIFSWQAQCVPGLLQTEEYARAVLRELVTTPGRAIDPEERLRARMARQPLLRRDGKANPPPQFHTVLAEAVVRTQVGGRDVMGRQVSKLWELSRQPNITLQILPFDAGAHAGMEGSFVILGFADEADPDVVYIEGPAGDVYPESAEQVTRSKVTAQRLIDVALSPDASAAFLADLTRE